MPKIVGTSQIVVDDGAGLTINELVGNIASKDDRISIAHVKINNPTSEPWLTLEYDEWICVLAGRMVIHHAGKKLDVVAGQAAFIGKGERFKPEFPGKYANASAKYQMYDYSSKLKNIVSTTH